MLDFQDYTYQKKVIEEDKKTDNKSIFKILNPFSPGSTRYFYADAETSMPADEEVVRW